MKSNQKFLFKLDKEESVVPETVKTLTDSGGTSFSMDDDSVDAKTRFALKHNMRVFYGDMRITSWTFNDENKLIIGLDGDSEGITIEDAIKSIKERNQFIKAIEDIE